MAVKKAKVPELVDYSFFQSVKTGDKFADSGRKRETKTWIDTGSYTFNAIISGDMTKGFPGNKAVMLAGEQAVGKTFFAIYGFARPLVNMGYFIFYIDTENALSDDDLIGYGLPEGSFKLISQDVIEELKGNFDKVLTQLEEAMGKSLENKNKCAFVIDSQGMLDTLKSRKDIQTENYVGDMTAQKEMKRFYKSILVRMGALDVPLLITNHVYANIGGYGDPTKVAGGSGGLYASSVILHMRKKQYKEGEVRKGTIITAKNIKSRFCRDGLEASFYLNWERGLNKYYGIHLFAESADLIEPWNEKMSKKGIVGPEGKIGKTKYYVIKDPKITPDKWIVCKETELHKETTIGTIFNEVNEHVKDIFKLTRPADFNYNDVEDENQDLDVNDDNLEDADTVVTKAKKAGKIIESDSED